MASYYISITSFDLGINASSYLNNNIYRVTEQTKNFLGDEFWKNYATVYNKFKSENRLLFRAKIIKNNNVLIKQVWQSKSDRDNFTKEVNEDYFNQYSNLVPTREFYYIDKNEIDSFIKTILEEKEKILQHVSQDLQQPGMVIGDTIKGDKLIYVN